MDDLARKRAQRAAVTEQARTEAVLRLMAALTGKTFTLASTQTC